jgi:uncharacterized protein YcsI (UPF0317 family)
MIDHLPRWRDLLVGFIIGAGFVMCIEMVRGAL